MPKSIIGDGFKEWVKTQVETRQAKLSRNDRDDNNLKYINNKTSWTRLSSGVNVDPTKAAEKGVTNSSNNLLAKKSVLFSARKYTDGTNNKASFTKGIGYYTNNPSYGYTPAIGIAGSDLKETGQSPSDISDYGLTPPAGITSVDIKSLNNGSLREANIQITCHSQAQFRIIEMLYLRLGYSMLLEWGHTLWYDNSKTLRSDMPDEIHQDFLSDAKLDQDAILEKLNVAREKYCGNYDAFLGIVVNFSWKIRGDGGYDITLNMRAIGDVIESLKINVNYPTNEQVAPQQSTSTEPPAPQPAIVANKNKSSLHQILFAIKTELDMQGYLDGFNAGGRTSLSAEEIIRITKGNSQHDLIKVNYKDPNEIWNQANNILTWQEGIKAWFNSITTDPAENATGGSMHYIKLGALLRIMESFLLKYDTSKGNAGSHKPLFYIDHDYDTNICLTTNGQMSLDPKVCFLPPSETVGGNPPVKNFNGYNHLFRLENEKYYFVGRFMHIGVNLEYIAYTLASEIDGDGKMSILSFLKNLMSGIQTAIGSINNFDVTYDETTNLFSIRDLNNIPYGNLYLRNLLKDNKQDIKPTKFNISLLKSTEGSFVKDMSVTSQLTNEFKTMITVGAQANGNKVGEDATALSKFNTGYVDRVITNKSSVVDDNNSTDPTSTTSSTTKTAEDIYKDQLTAFYTLKDHIDDGTVTEEEISTNSSSVVDLLKYNLGKLTQDGNIPGGTGFIPLNLSLTLDGLSGMRLFEAYTINDEILPDNYRNYIKFIIRGISHKIDASGWTTVLESFSIPKTLEDTLNEYTPKVTFTGVVKRTDGAQSSVEQTVNTQNTKTSIDKCGKATSDTVNTVYPRSVKWLKGPDPVKVPAEKSPGYTVNLANQSVVGYVKTIKTYQEVIQAVETVIDQLAPNASSSNKKLIIVSALAVSISEQGYGDGSIKGFNNNLTGTEKSGFSVFKASDVNGKVSLTEGGTGKQKYYYSFTTIEAGYVPLVSKILERNMFASSGAPNEWAWRYFRDWNGYGARTKKSYIEGKTNDCTIIEGNEKKYNKALKAVNTYSKYR